jgi:hypothetical protein
MLLRQLFDSQTSTFTYLLADQKTRRALLIDPVAAQSERDLTLLADLVELIRNLNLPPLKQLAIAVPANRACGNSTPQVQES